MSANHTPISTRILHHAGGYDCSPNDVRRHRDEIGHGLSPGKTQTAGTGGELLCRRFDIPCGLLSPDVNAYRQTEPPECPGLCLVQHDNIVLA